MKWAHGVNRYFPGVLVVAIAVATATAEEAWKTAPPPLRAGAVYNLMSFVRAEQGAPPASSSAYAYAQAIRELQPIADRAALTRAAAGPWSDVPAVRKWIDGNATVFREFVKASMIRHAHLQITPSRQSGLDAELQDALFAVNVPGLAAFDLVAQGLLASAWAKWDDDGGQAVVDAACDVMRIGRSLQREYPMIAQREAIRIIERGQGAFRHALLLSESRADLAKRLMFHSDEVSEPLPSLASAYHFERLSVLDALQRVYASNSGGTGEQVWAIVGDGGTTSWDVIESEVRDVGFETSIAEANAFFDVVMLWCDSPDGTVIAREKEIRDQASRLKNPITRQMVRGIVAPQHGLLRAEATRRGLHILNAVFLNWVSTNKYVDSLDFLIRQKGAKKFVSDPHNGEPLVYVRTRDGFVLYSVGPDLKDDGGRPFLPGTEKGDVVIWPLR